MLFTGSLSKIIRINLRFSRFADYFRNLHKHDLFTNRNAKEQSLCENNIARLRDKYRNSCYVKTWKNAKMEVKVVVKKSTNNYLKK